MRGALANPTMANMIVTRNGYNSDIIKALNSRFPMAVEQCRNVSFSGGTFLEKGRAIWNYLKNSVQYRKDEPGKQVIQLPSRLILDTKQGDCKSLGLAAAAFMYNNGFRNVALRYASYNPTDPTPTHVYAVGYDDKGNEIIIDPVYRQFNQEVPYKSKIDYPMEISVLSGIAGRPQKNVQLKRIRVKVKGDPYKRAEKLLDVVRPGSMAANVLKNFLRKREKNPANMIYSDAQLMAYAKRLRAIVDKSKAIPPFVRQLMSDELNDIQNRRFTGFIVTNDSASIAGIREEIGRISLKKIGKGIKKVAKKVSPKNLLKGVKTVALTVPRKAFLAMVALNVRGLATRLKKLNTEQIKKLWVQRFGGQQSVLVNAIKKGSKKKPLFGAGKKVRAIKGIGYLIDESDGIGAEPVSTSAIIASAAPILIAFMKLLKSQGVPEVPEAAAAPGESGDFPEADGMAQDSKPGLMDYVGKALGIAKETGIIPDPPLDGNAQRVDQALPGDDHTDMEEKSGTAFEINPLLLLGAAAGAVLLMRK